MKVMTSQWKQKTQFKKIFYWENLLTAYFFVFLITPSCLKIVKNGLEKNLLSIIEMESSKLRVKGKLKIDRMSWLYFSFKTAVSWIIDFFYAWATDNIQQIYL